MGCKKMEVKDEKINLSYTYGSKAFTTGLISVRCVDIHFMKEIIRDVPVGNSFPYVQAWLHRAEAFKGSLVPFEYVDNDFMNEVIRDCPAGNSLPYLEAWLHGYADVQMKNMNSEITCYSVFVCATNGIGGFLHYFNTREALDDWYAEVKQSEKETGEKVYHQEPKEIHKREYDKLKVDRYGSEYTFFHD